MNNYYKSYRHRGLIVTVYSCIFECQLLLFVSDEYKGHLSIEAARQADTAKLKKYYTPDVLNFKHPYSGDTAVHVVVNSLYPKRKQALDLLIRKGASLVEKNKDFLTALHIAADNSHYDLMDVLLRHGAKVNALDGLGQTALHR